MSGIGISKRVKTQTLVPHSILTVKDSRLKSQPYNFSLIKSSHLKNRSNFSGLQQSRVKNTKVFMAFQQPHLIKVGLSSQFRQSSCRKNRNKSRIKEDQVQNSKYEILKQISQGSTGIVFIAKNYHHKTVAIKQVITSRNKQNHQLNILKDINHPHLIQLQDYFFKAQQDRCLLHLVTQYYPITLRDMIRHRSIEKSKLPLYLYQILTGLQYLQQHAIMHRDLTPQNILVDPNIHKVVIADFGSAKKVRNNMESLSYVGSRAYRAPELLFGSINYGTEVDMWSFGCILLQLINGSVIFKGKTSIQQTLQIMKRLGTPSQSQMGCMNTHFSLSQYQILPKIKKKSWKDILNIRDNHLLDLIEKLMVYDPKKRLTPRKAIQHPYFDSLRHHNPQQIKLYTEILDQDRQYSQTKSINLSIQSPESPKHQTSQTITGKQEQSTRSNVGHRLRPTRGVSSILKTRLF